MVERRIVVPVVEGSNPSTHPSNHPCLIDLTPDSGRRMFGMREVQMAKPDLEERKILLLEAIAASAIFAIFAVVLYMVFSYKPG